MKGVLELSEKLVLDLGSGIFPYKGKKGEKVLHLDVKPFKCVEIVRDLNRGLPMGYEVVDKVIASNVLEHFGGDDFIFVMNEIWRVLKKDGLLEVSGPLRSGMFAWIDPGHVRPFDDFSFDFFVVKDDNSYCAGVRGWFDLVKRRKDVKGGGMYFTLKKVIK